MNTYYDTAAQFFNQGEYKKSIKILEQLTADFPDNLMFKNLLGLSYLKNKNTGKAITTFENLITIQPDNASFIAFLANAYLLRGWSNKANDILKNNIIVDENNVLQWIELTNHYIDNTYVVESKKTFNELLQQTAEKSDNLSISIHLQLLIINTCNEDLEGMEKTLGDLSSIAAESEEYKNHIASVLLKISEHLIQAHMTEAAKKILDKSNLVSAEDKKINNLNFDINESTPKECHLPYISNKYNWFNNYTNNSRKTKKPYIRNEKKLGRNMLCPCGSEKKYKKCCGK